MGLEEAIHQKKFRNAHLKAMVNILYTHGWLSERIKKYLQDENISMQQYNILRILRGAKMPISTMQIRERMLDRMSDTSRIVDRMILKGLAQKKVSSFDKRLVDVTITDQGLDMLARLDRQLHLLDGIMLTLADSDAEMLNNLLDKMRGE